MRSQPRLGLAGALLAAGLLVSGCSALSTTPASGDGGGSASADGAQGELAGAPDANRSRADQSRAGQSRAGNTVGKGEIRDRSIVRVGRMSILVNDVRAAAGKAAALVGGTEAYVESEQSAADDDGKITSSQVVLRVEVDDYDRVADALRTLGEVRADESKTTDVTEEVVDVESRIESQEESLARMRTLLGSAKTVGAVIQVESELSVRQAELESLQSRYAVLSSQTSLSTITVDLERKDSVEDALTDEGGFLWGLGRGWDALLGAGGVLLTVVGVLLPFAAIGAIVFVPTWLLLRNRRRRAPTAPPEPAPTPGA